MEALKRIAARERRSVSWLVAEFLRQHLEHIGELPADDKSIVASQSNKRS